MSVHKDDDRNKRKKRRAEDTSESDASDLLLKNADMAFGLNQYPGTFDMAGSANQGFPPASAFQAMLARTQLNDRLPELPKASIGLQSAQQLPGIGLAGNNLQAGGLATVSPLYSQSTSNADTDSDKDVPSGAHDLLKNAAGLGFGVNNDGHNIDSKLSGSSPTLNNPTQGNLFNPQINPTAATELVNSVREQAAQLSLSDLVPTPSPTEILETLNDQLGEQGLKLNVDGTDQKMETLMGHLDSHLSDTNPNINLDHSDANSHTVLEALNENLPSISPTEQSKISSSYKPHDTQGSFDSQFSNFDLSNANPTTISPILDAMVDQDVRSSDDSAILSETLSELLNEITNSDSNHKDLPESKSDVIGSFQPDELKNLKNVIVTTPSTSSFHNIQPVTESADSFSAGAVENDDYESNIQKILDALTETNKDALSNDDTNSADLFSSDDSGEKSTQLSISDDTVLDDLQNTTRMGDFSTDSKINIPISDKENDIGSDDNLFGESTFADVLDDAVDLVKSEKDESDKVANKESSSISMRDIPDALNDQISTLNDKDQQTDEHMEHQQKNDDFSKGETNLHDLDAATDIQMNDNFENQKTIEDNLGDFLLMMESGAHSNNDEGSDLDNNNDNKQSDSHTEDKIQDTDTNDVLGSINDQNKDETLGMESNLHDILENNDAKKKTLDSDSNDKTTDEIVSETEETLSDLMGAIDDAKEQTQTVNNEEGKEDTISEVMPSDISDLDINSPFTDIDSETFGDAVIDGDEDTFNVSQGNEEDDASQIVETTDTPNSEIMDLDDIASDDNGDGKDHGNNLNNVKISEADKEDLDAAAPGSIEIGDLADSYEKFVGNSRGDTDARTREDIETLDDMDEANAVIENNDQVDNHTLEHDEFEVKGKHQRTPIDDDDTDEVGNIPFLAEASSPDDQMTAILPAVGDQEMEISTCRQKLPSVCFEYQLEVMSQGNSIASLDHPCRLMPLDKSAKLNYSFLTNFSTIYGHRRYLNRK